MRFIRYSSICICILAIFITNGCSTYHTTAYLKSHSLDAFMIDRPQAAVLLHQYPAFEDWLRTEWDQPIEGNHFCWSNEQPFNSPVSEVDGTARGHLIMVHVSEKLRPVDQLVALSFELCNAQGHAGMGAISEQAVAGKITREDFVNEINRREYAASQRVKKILEKLLPLSTKQAATTSLYKILMETPNEFQESQAWEMRIDSQNYIHRQELYGKQFDELVKKGN